jgi:hypothetical protein
MESTQVGNGNGYSDGYPFDEHAITHDIVIDPPVEFSDGKTYDHLHLAEPLAGQMRQAENELKGEVNVYTLRSYQIALVSHCSGVPRGVIEKMRISQVDEASAFLQRFTRGGRATGAN